MQIHPGFFLPGGRIAEEKKNTDSLASQGIAETIVFSLLQKQCHTEFENQLTPNIFNDRRSFRISMYNADGDCLLSMALIPFLQERMSIFTINIDPINGFTLQTIMFETSRERVQLQSRFNELVKEKLEIYSNSLKCKTPKFFSVRERTLT